MLTGYIPEIVQVVPNPGHKVDIYFSDGKITTYDLTPFLDSGVFRALRDEHIFFDRCCIMNGTLAWDIVGDGDLSACIDIDPETLYEGEAIDDPLAVS